MQLYIIVLIVDNVERILAMYNVQILIKYFKDTLLKTSSQTKTITKINILGTE